MATQGDIPAAIAKIRHNPSGASLSKYELGERAALQAGSLGNEARAALGGRR